MQNSKIHIYLKPQEFSIFFFTASLCLRCGGPILLEVIALNLWTKFENFKTYVRGKKH